MSEPYAALSLTDLDAFNFPPVEWIVDGTLPAGALALMVGREKTGKSLVCIDMVASVALGEPFLGHATEQGPAIYVPAEDALRLVRDRIWTRIGQERDAPLYVLPADGSVDLSVRLDDAESFGRLAATIERIRPRIVVLDPLREFHHRKENDADEMAGLLRPLRQLAHDTDTLIVLPHHRNKHATNPSLATRGSSAISAGVDIIITMELPDESGDEGITPDKVLTLRIEGRYGPRQNLAVRLHPGLRWEPTSILNVDDLPVRQKILRHLEVTGDCLTVDDLLAATGGARSHLQNALRRLLKDGKVSRDGAGTKADAFRYRAIGYQATYAPAYEPAYENSRVHTTKTDDSHVSGEVYTPDEHTNSDRESTPLCPECNEPLDSPTAMQLGRHVHHLSDEEWQAWLVTGYSVGSRS